MKMLLQRHKVILLQRPNGINYPALFSVRAILEYFFPFSVVDLYCYVRKSNDNVATDMCYLIYNVSLHHKHFK